MTGAAHSCASVRFRGWRSPSDPPVPCPHPEWQSNISIDNPSPGASSKPSQQWSASLSWLMINLSQDFIVIIGALSLSLAWCPTRFGVQSLPESVSTSNDFYFCCHPGGNKIKMPVIKAIPYMLRYTDRFRLLSKAIFRGNLQVWRRCISV